MFDFLFPRVCGICGKKINERYTCIKCLNILEYYQRLEDCNVGVAYYDKLISLFPYQGILKSKMLQLKFFGNRYIAKTFGDLMAHYLIKENITADLIIPVPISKKRMFERGYNQSDDIAKVVALLTNIPYENRGFIKIKNNAKQSMVTQKDRIKNVENVYQVTKKNIIENQVIILIDDIYTTGATVNECAKILKKNGAKKVIAFTALYSTK